MLWSKHFGFGAAYSTDHAITKLVDKIPNHSIKCKYTIGVFIDLLMVFDTVNYNLLLEKLETYGVKNTHLQWFECYLVTQKTVYGS